MSDLAAAPPAVAAAPAQASAEVKAPDLAAAPGPEPPEATEEYEIDGRKVALTKTQAKTYIQKAAAVDKRMQSAAEKEKKLEQLLAEWEKDPEEAYRKAGKDPEKRWADVMERRAKQALLTPEQREAADLKEKLAKHEAAEAKRAADAKKQADDELDQSNRGALQDQLINGAIRHGLDRTPEVLEGLADVGFDLVGLLGETVTVDQVIEEYLRRESEHFEARDRKLLSKLKGPRLVEYLKANVPALLKLSPSELLEALGPDGVKAVQAATLTRMPGPGGPAKVNPTKAAAPPPRNNVTGQFTRHISEAEFNKKFGVR